MGKKRQKILQKMRNSAREKLRELMENVELRGENNKELSGELNCKCNTKLSEVLLNKKLGTQTVTTHFGELKEELRGHSRIPSVNRSRTTPTDLEQLRPCKDLERMNPMCKSMLAAPPIIRFTAICMENNVH